MCEFYQKENLGHFEQNLQVLVVSKPASALYPDMQEGRYAAENLYRNYLSTQKIRVNGVFAAFAVYGKFSNSKIILSSL